MPTKGKMPEIVRWFFNNRISIRISYIAIIILIISTICVLLNAPYKNVSDTYSGNPGTTTEITDGVKLQQDFIANRDYDFFGIYFPNYLNFFREGKLYIKITNNQNSEQFEYNTREMLNESYFYINYSLRHSEKYTLDIWVENIPKEKAFKFSTVKPVNGDLSPLIVDGKKSDDTLLMTFVYQKKDYFITWYLVLEIVLILLYLVLFVDKEFYGKTK